MVYLLDTLASYPFRPDEVLGGVGELVPSGPVASEIEPPRSDV